MAIGGKVAGPHPADQRLEARVARGVGAQHQGVDEEPDQLVQRGIAAPGDRAADGDVGARPQPRQQPRQPRLQHHEQARAAAPRQRRKPAVQTGINRQGHPPAAMAGHRRPRPVGRQLDLLRQPGQRRGPVRQLPRHHACAIVLGAEHRLLPQRVVGVLHRQRRKLRRHPRAARPVKRRQIPRQRTERPAVAGDVMQQHSSTCCSAPSSNRCARSGSSHDRSKPRPAAAVSAAARLASSAAATASRSRAAPGSRIDCRGTPRCSGNTVRRLSCRSIRSHSAPSSAARSSRPTSRSASGIT